MEKCGNLGSACGSAGLVIVACSACAGDYEDPDRGAWAADEGDDEIDDQRATMNFGPMGKRGSSVETRKGHEIAERSSNDEHENENHAENEDGR